MEAAGPPEISAGRDPELNMAPAITTDRLLLRRWRHEDREPFAAMNADPRVMEFYRQRLSREESDAYIDRIEAHFENKGFGLFAAELRESGEFIGYSGLRVPGFEASFTPCVEIGWRLAAGHWGRGLATESARAALLWGFESLGLPEIVSFAVPANVRSIRVMQKLGMKRDEAGDFDHPNLPPGHPLRRHVLYRAARV
jgi:RimJ/RimL family protein N-acetyltransferase